MTDDKVVYLRDVFFFIERTDINDVKKTLTLNSRGERLYKEYESRKF